MERIVIEVDPKVAEAWHTLSPDRRKKPGNEVSVRIGKELPEGSKEEYLRYLDELQKTMKERGLTQERLDEILNEDR